MNDKPQNQVSGPLVLTHAIPDQAVNLWPQTVDHIKALFPEDAEVNSALLVIQEMDIRNLSERDERDLIVRSGLVRNKLDNLMREKTDAIGQPLYDDLLNAYHKAYINNGAGMSMEDFLNACGATESSVQRYFTYETLPSFISLANNIGELQRVLAINSDMETIRAVEQQFDHEISAIGQELSLPLGR